MIDEVDFQIWLGIKEDEGCWTCCMYHMGFTLVAGFDRGRSGRTILPSSPRAKTHKTFLPPRPKPTRKTATIRISEVTSKRKKKGDGMAKQSETLPITPEGRYEDIEMQEIPAAEAGVSLEEMSEVLWGKQRER